MGESVSVMMIMLNVSSMISVMNLLKIRGMKVLIVMSRVRVGEDEE